MISSRINLDIAHVHADSAKIHYVIKNSPETLCASDQFTVGCTSDVAKGG